MSNKFSKGQSVTVRPLTSKASDCCTDVTYGKVYTVCGVGDESGTPAQAGYFLLKGTDVSDCVSFLDDVGDLVTLESEDFVLC
jgi:hypothetical protein